MAGRVRGVSKNPDEARRKLIASALTLFGKQGFRATSTEQIAERAGYGQATIFFHFKTKAGLLEACLEEALKRAIGSLPSSDRLGVLELIRRIDAVFSDRPTAEFFASLMAEQSRNNVVQPIYASYHAHVRNMIRDEIIHETGACPDEALSAAGSILCMMIGVHAQQRVEQQLFSRADYSDMLTKASVLLIEDLRRRKRARDPS